MNTNLECQMLEVYERLERLKDEAMRDYRESGEEGYLGRVEAFTEAMAVIYESCPDLREKL